MLYSPYSPILKEKQNTNAMLTHRFYYYEKTKLLYLSLLNSNYREMITHRTPILSKFKLKRRYVVFIVPLT